MTNRHICLVVLAIKFTVAAVVLGAWLTASAARAATPWTASAAHRPFPGAQRLSEVELDRSSGSGRRWFVHTRL